MTGAFLVLLGVVAGGFINAAVQVYLREVERRRSIRLAARVLISEFAEIASTKINSEHEEDSSHLHAAWREHRASLVDLGGEDWRIVDSAVMWVVYPDHFLPERPNSNPVGDRIELAVVVLENHSGLPSELRSL